MALLQCGSENNNHVLKQMTSLMIFILMGSSNNSAPAVSEVSGSSSSLSSLGFGYFPKSMTPVQFACFLIGVCCTLVLVGSMAFFIGIMMMPLVGFVSTVALFLAVVAPGALCFSK